MARSFNAAFTAALQDNTKFPIYAASLVGHVQSDLVTFNMTTGIVVEDVTGFPPSGGLKINDELFTYQSIDTGANRFEGLQRAVFATSDGGTPTVGTAVKVAYMIASDDIAGRVGDPSIHLAMESYKASSQRLNSLEGQSTTGAVNMKFLDLNDFFTVALSANSAAFREKELRVIVGFDSLSEDEYEVESVSYVQSLKMDNELASWMLSAGDTQRLLHAPMTLGVTKLRTAITGTPANADVDSVVNFDPNGGYFRVEDEIIAYTSTTGGATPTLNGLTRAQFGTVSVDHAIDETVSEVYEIQDNPVDLILQILTSTGDGTNGAYDVLPAEKGIGIDESLIDITSFEFERDNFITNTSYRFRIPKTIPDLKPWIEQQIMKPLNANFKASADGTIGFVYNRPIFTVDENIGLDQDNIEGKPRWDQNMDSTVNQITIQRDKDVFDEDFKVQDIFLDVTSVSLHGLAQEYVLESDGIHTDLDGEQLTLKVEKQVRRRFGNPPPKVNLICQMSKLDFEVGDIVFLSHPSLPDSRNEDRGLRNVQYQVIQRRPDYLNGKISLELLDTRRTGRYGGIAPDTSKDSPPDPFPDYPDAGPLDRQYMFISNNSGKMSNGDDGYSII